MTRNCFQLRLKLKPLVHSERILTEKKFLTFSNERISIRFSLGMRPETEERPFRIRKKRSFRMLKVLLIETPGIARQTPSLSVFGKKDLIDLLFYFILFFPFFRADQFGTYLIFACSQATFA